MGGTMKKAVIHAPRQAGLVDVPIPEPRGDLVLVKVRAVPMCTEYNTFVAGGTAAALGHEGVGEVAAVDGHSDLAVGDRVVIMGLRACGTCRYCRAGHFMHCMRKTGHGSQPRSQPGGAQRTGGAVVRGAPAPTPSTGWRAPGCCRGSPRTSPSITRR